MEKLRRSETGSSTKEDLSDMVADHTRKTRKRKADAKDNRAAKKFKF